MSSLPLVLTLLQATWTPTADPDSAAALVRAAQRAEQHYESVLRRFAPVTRDWPRSGPCDERIGRFCLRFSDEDRPSRPLPPEPLEAVRARRDAVEAMRRAFAVAPDERAVAAPLTRYLVEDDRAEEAVATARTFAWASGDSVWGPLLLGFALHYAADAEAEAVLERALAGLPADERRRVDRIRPLLEPDERRRFDRLNEAEREAYRAAYWRASQPLYLLPYNERRTEHISRWIWSRLLEAAPRVTGSHSWGWDLEELTVRYGVPVRRERTLHTGVSFVPLSQLIVERYDPAQLALSPRALTADEAWPAPRPGESSPLERRRVRTRHAPVAVRRLVELDHQVSRFPAGDSVVLRIDGALPLDSLARTGGEPPARPPTSVQSGLFILDDEFDILHERRRRAPVRADTARLSFRIRLQPGVFQYSLEALDSDTRLAGRARYRVTIEPPASPGPVLSDVLVAAPFGDGWLPSALDHPALHALPRLVVGPESVLGLYAEAHGFAPRGSGSGMTSYRVELSLHRADDDASLPVRAARWLGRVLTLVDEPERPRIAWEAEGEAGAPAVMALDVDLAGIEPDLYAIRLVVTDLVTGESATTERIIRVDTP